MTKYHLHQQFHSLLLLFVLINSCNGQNTMPLPKDSTNIPTGQRRKADTDKAASYGPNDIVQCAIQDKAGNLWFGTTGGEGVFRYDGNTFTNYTEKDGLCNNEVGAILEDKDGYIWFGTNDGACRYDGKTFTKVPIHNDGPNQTPHQFSFKSIVGSILQDKAGNLWFATMGEGVYRYDGTSFTNFLFPEVVKCMHEDTSGDIWVGSWSNGGLYRSDKPKLGQPVADFTRQNGIDDTMIECIFEDKKGNVWIGTRDHGVCRYDGKSFTNFSGQNGLPNNNISLIVEDKTGNLWFGSCVKLGYKIGGLCRYDGKTFATVATKEGLENNDFFWGVMDKKDNLWFGGRYGRLFRYDGNAFADFSEQVHQH